MRIIVFSDSHGDVDTMRAVLRREKPDAVFHLGDCVSDGLSLQGVIPGIPVRVVRGNNDYYDRCGDEDIIKVCGKRIFLTHGHLYGVKRGLMRLSYKGAELGVDAVLFGHTHLAYTDIANGIWLMNPGSAQSGYGIVMVEGDELRCELKRLPRI